MITGDTLTQWGVLGMRWGIRRNESKNNGPHKEASSVKKAKVKAKELSDEELVKIIKRLQMEKQYNSLNNEDVSRGKKIVTKIIKAGTTAAAVTTTAITLYNNTGKIKDIVKQAVKK